MKSINHGGCVDVLVLKPGRSGARSQADALSSRPLAGRVGQLAHRLPAFEIRLQSVGSVITGPYCQVETEITLTSRSRTMVDESSGRSRASEVLFGPWPGAVSCSKSAIPLESKFWR